MDQEGGTFQGEKQQLMLEGVAHVLGLGRHILMLAKTLTKKLDAPIHTYPAAATIRPRHGGKSVIFKTLRLDNRLFDIKPRRCIMARMERGRPDPSNSLVAVR